jgi:hypothetical protein
VAFEACLRSHPLQPGTLQQLRWPRSPLERTPITRDTRPRLSRPLPRHLLRGGPRDTLGRGPRRQNALVRGSFVYHMVLHHEYQHNETMLQILPLMKGESYRSEARVNLPPGNPPEEDMLHVPGGPSSWGRTTARGHCTTSAQHTRSRCRVSIWVKLPSPTAPLCRFQVTTLPELRFHVLLLAGAQEVRLRNQRP